MNGFSQLLVDFFWRISPNFNGLNQHMGNIHG